MTVELPRLRDRRSDIPSLFTQFLRKHSRGACPSVGTKLCERLCLHGWPGNVRELEVLAQNLLARFPGEERLRQRHLPAHLQAAEGEATSSEPRRDSETRSAHDRRKFASALERAGGNVKLAAQMIGISRQRAYRLMDSEKVSDGRKDSEPS
jgi:DNA-binding NtrC family response regulator